MPDDKCPVLTSEDLQVLHLPPTIIGENTELSIRSETRKRKMCAFEIAVINNLVDIRYDKYLRKVVESKEVLWFRSEVRRCLTIDIGENIQYTLPRSLALYNFENQVDLMQKVFNVDAEGIQAFLTKDNSAVQFVNKLIDTVLLENRRSDDDGDDDDDDDNYDDDTP